MSSFPIVQFMPWCPISREYSAGPIAIIPFERNNPMDSLGKLDLDIFKKVLACYRDLEGHSVKKVAVLCYRGKPLISNLSKKSLRLTAELVELACFSGLAHRDYFDSLGPYCNASCFELYAQRLETGRFMAIESRRRGGRSLAFRPIAETVFSIPEQANSIHAVVVDEGLLAGLVAFRNHVQDGEWARWRDAIACFDQANTDAQNFRWQVEWILLCSAFQRILGADSKSISVAEKFAKALVPSSTVPIGKARRKSSCLQKLNPHPLRYGWMEEFYRLRNDFAHGRLQTSKVSAWSQDEHLVLACIAFPLVIRCLLEQRGQYSFTDNDRVQIDIFEALADRRFLNRPKGAGSSVDTVWNRLIRRSRMELATRMAASDLERQGFFQKRTKARALRT